MSHSSQWELENYPEGEIQEMVDIYTERGMSREDATTVITVMAQYKEFFVDVMMAEELQLQVPEEVRQPDPPILPHPCTHRSHLDASLLVFVWCRTTSGPPSRRE